MRFFAPPRGGILLGKRLYAAPTLRTEKLGAPGRFLFISDLHLRKEHPEALSHLLAACGDVRADAVFLGGDLAEYEDGREKCLKALSERFAGLPIFAVPGNNDRYEEDEDRAKERAQYEGFGIRLLLNERADFSVNGVKVQVVGVDDALRHEPRAEGLFDEGGYKVLLSHAPHSFLLKEQPDLFLSGHTHGGQINVCGLTAYLLNYEPYYRLAALAGTRRVGKTALLVSRGIGCSKLPIRVGANPEIHLIV